MQLQKNMGPLDRAIRVGVAIAAGGLILTGVVQGVLAIILAVVAIMFLLTSAVSFCPMYKPLGLTTMPNRSAE